MENRILHNKVIKMWEDKVKLVTIYEIIDLLKISKKSVFEILEKEYK